jgi:hypothetical protein
MKSNSPEYGDPMPQEERPLWEEFCDDHELLERLEVTPQELTALKDCVLLGELTCKQDMLFILRQIRLATEPSSKETTISFAPDPRRDNKAEDSAKEIGAPANYRPLASVRSTPEPASPAGISRSRAIEQFGVLCWTLVLLGFLVWNLVTRLPSWRQTFIATIGVQTHQPAAPEKRSVEP